MRFKVHCANPQTGEEFDREVDAQTFQDAEREAQRAGMLVSKVTLAAESPPAGPSTPQRRTKVCPSCREAIDAKATKCPHCRKTQPSGLVGMLVAIGLLIVAAAYFVNTWNSGSEIGGGQQQSDKPATVEPTPKTPIDEAASVIASYYGEYGELPPLRHGQQLISEWRKVRDQWGNRLRYTQISGGGFEIRSSGGDASFDTDDDVVKVFPLLPDTGVEPQLQRAESPRPQRRASKPGQEWYSGGTLHKATIGEWKAASYQNRLATCSDFIAGTLLDRGMKAKNMDISEGGLVWRWATELEICISKGTSGHALTDHQGVAGIAALCLILMKF